MDSRSKDLWNDGRGGSVLLAFTSYYLLSAALCFSSVLSVPSVVQRLFAFFLSSPHLLATSPYSWIPDQKTSGMTDGVGVSALLAFTSYYLLSAALCFSSVPSVTSVVQRLFAFFLSSPHLLATSPYSWIPDQKTSGMTRRDCCFFSSVLSVSSVVQRLFALDLFCFSLVPIYSLLSPAPTLGFQIKRPLE